MARHELRGADNNFLVWHTIYHNGPPGCGGAVRREKSAQGQSTRKGRGEYTFSPGDARAVLPALPGKPRLS
ncbi:hypothetical protein GCM10027346_35920 [Hymenobacter seoulensis]